MDERPDDRPQAPAPPFGTPLGVFQTLGASLKVYFSNLNTLIVIVAIFVIPATILTVLAVRLTIGDALLDIDPNAGNPFEGMSTSEVVTIAAAFLIGTALNLVISMIATGACFRAVHEALLGNKPDWRSSIQAAMERVSSLVWLPLLIGLIFIAGAAVGVALIGLLGAVNDQLGAIAGLGLFGLFVYVFVSWSVAIPALMAENQRGLDALRRSQRLIKGQWLPTFGVYVVAFFLIIVISGILTAIFNPAARTGDEGLVLSTLSSVVSNVIFTPFQAALVGVVYFNLLLKETPSIPPEV
jgi:hypothetical protein